MLFLKSNSELKNVFNRLIKTMNAPIEWNGIFVIINNNMILAGKVRSLVFNFDNKKTHTNLLDIPFEEQTIETLPENELLTDIFNMTLYAFGKWGTIAGLKVEKDYNELNGLFTNILRKINIQPEFLENTFRFYQEGVRVAFEDVVNDAFIAANSEEEPDLDEEQEAQEQYELGLWHNMKWKSHNCSFQKVVKEDEPEKRIGNNFYHVNYFCPDCRVPIYMTTYPEEEEVCIETEEGRVYLARAYTCDSCNSFYTPKPGKLLKEGDIFSLSMVEDRTAYEDYLDILGKKGSKTSSFKFNEYEWQRNKKKEENEINEESTTDDNGNDKRESHIIIDNENNTASPDLGTASPNNIDTKQYRTKQDYIKQQNQQGKAAEQAEKHRLELLLHSADSLKKIVQKAQLGAAKGNQNETDKEVYLKTAKQILREKLNSQYETKINNLGRMSSRQLNDFKQQLFGEKNLEQTEVNAYVEKVNKRLYEVEKANLRQKVDNSKNKSYSELTHIIREVVDGEGLEDVRGEVLLTLKSMKADRGKQEVETLIKNMPVHMTRKQYELFKDKLEQYTEADISPYRQILERKRDIVEKDEISAFVKRANKRNRKALNDLYEQLQQKDFNPSNTAPYLEKIKDKIGEFDKAAIAQICPDIMDISFKDGLEIRDQISEGMFLPEIKRDVLEQVAARLTRIKMDENIQLVRKLEKEINEKALDVSRFYFYEARQFERKADGKQESKITAAIERATHTYAAKRFEYEYPILIYDSSRKRDGSKGFVLTPERIFYHDIFNSGIVNVNNVGEVSYGRGKFNHNINIKRFVGKKLKLPQKIIKKQREEFALIFDEFIGYLQEKPVSRSVAYLEKEKHAVICCYRCGFIYKDGNTCPKCGYKSNN